ncbi:MAG: NAD-dependent epimerase/dehydratase family protein [Dehalococcoidia bacterium]
MAADKVLVTGGAGFIGSHVVDLLASHRYEVVVVDSLITGRKENLNPYARLRDIDIRDSRLGRIFKEERPRFVCHHAAQPSIPTSIREPAEDADVNLVGSLHLLEQCREYGVEKFIYISSGGAVYGEPQTLPCPEDHSLQPRSPYGASKLAVEIYLPIYRELCGLRYTTLRYANVFGPRQDPYGEAGVVAIFAGQMLQGERVTINGTGEQERDFVYVEDVARANLACLEAGDGQAYNIGSGVGTSVNTVFGHLKGLTSYGREPYFGPPKEGEVFKIYLDVAKAERELGWKPSVSLEDGLARTVEHMRAELKTHQ